RIFEGGKEEAELLRQLRGNWEGKESALQKLVAAWNKYPLRQLREQPGIAIGFGFRYFASASFEGAPEEFTELSFIHDGNGHRTNAFVIDTLPPWFEPTQNAPAEKRSWTATDPSGRASNAVGFGPAIDVEGFVAEVPAD